MDNFVKLKPNEMLEIYKETSFRSKLNPEIIEKDFWVCWTLKCLYSIPEIASNIIFKGGTSLSKAYGLIDRFSEDCDITIDKRILNSFKDPTEIGISGKEQTRRMDSMITAAHDFVQNIILLSLNKEIGKYINYTSYALKLDEDDHQTILFSYPSCFELADKEKINLYIKPVIRLEFGARGGITPKENKAVTPYIAEYFPTLFKQVSCTVPVLSVERTFWEKITILHSLYHKHLKGKKIGNRMSRHYYDIYILIKKGISEVALIQQSLLEEVTRNNMIFFKDNNSSYETSKIGSLKLYPTSEMLLELKKDYNNMEDMFMHDQIPFEIIMNTISDLETKINNSI